MFVYQERIIDVKWKMAVYESALNEFKGRWAKFATATVGMYVMFPCVGKAYSCSTRLLQPGSLRPQCDLPDPHCRLDTRKWLPVKRYCRYTPLASIWRGSPLGTDSGLRRGGSRILLLNIRRCWFQGKERDFELTCDLPRVS